MKPSQYVKQFRVTDGAEFRLKDFDPAETLGLKSKEHAQETLESGVARLCDLQDKLFAQDRWAILVVLQAMDAAGKDSLIKHVMSGLNPQGCRVSSTTIICGGPHVLFLNAARSAFSIVLITKKFSWFEYIRKFCRANDYPRSWCREKSGGSALRTSGRTSGISIEMELSF